MTFLDKYHDLFLKLRFETPSKQCRFLNVKFVFSFKKSDECWYCKYGE